MAKYRLTLVDDQDIVLRTWGLSHSLEDDGDFVLPLKRLAPGELAIDINDEVERDLKRKGGTDA